MKIVSQVGFSRWLYIQQPFKAQEQLMVSQHLRLLGAIKRPVCRDMSINGQMSHFFKSRLTALFISSNWMGSTRFNLNSIYGNDNDCNYSRFLFITIKVSTIWWSKRLNFFSLCLFYSFDMSTGWSIICNCLFIYRQLYK